MPRPRNRVDDEEALIPRSDLEEFHMRTRKKMRGKCSFCCSVKCWFAMLLLLILMSTAVFYFIYPSVVHDNLSKIIGMACSASGYSSKPNATVTCLVMTSSSGLVSKVPPINKTWGSQCTHTMYFYGAEPGQQPVDIPGIFMVNNVTSLQPISIALKGNVTSWYLQASDDVYVSYRKLQRHLSSHKSYGPMYVGDRIQPDGATNGVFALNYEAAMLLVNKTKSAFTENMTGAISINLNMTDVDGTSKLTVDNPLQMEGDKQMKDMSNAFAFKNVSPDQMYSFYVFNTE